MKTVALFTTPAGKTAMEVSEFTSADGKVFYSYIGTYGAGSGHNANQMRAEIVALKYNHPRTQTVYDHLTSTK